MAKNHFRTALLLLSLLLSTTTAWADSNFGGGDGSAKNPYIITTSAHWDQLGEDVAAGTNYSGKYFRLDEDISVTTMLGTGNNGNDAKPFKGTFDGNGHTLTVNYEAESDVVTAPFRFITSATIKNLHVNGTITTAYRHAAGLAGRTYGTTLIQGCRVSTVIKSSVAGDGTHGGIVSIKPDWSSAKLTIDACVFDGKILTTGPTPTTHCAGFVGYTSYGSLTITNSIYAPATLADGEAAIDREMTFYRYNANHPGTITTACCYYTQTMGEAQGKQPHGISIQEGFTIVPTGNATYHSTTGITTYEGNQCMKYNDIIFAGEGDQPKLTFAHNYGNSVGYSVGSAALEGNNTDGYTLTMPDADVTIAVSGISAEGIAGSGSSTDPYIISKATDWDIIVSHVNKGDGNYASAYYQLTSDISVTTMMGNSDYRFKGHFDGNDHTLTVNYTSSEDYAAPFRFVNGADIKDLKVDGTITTSRKFAAGIIANAADGATITNCRVSAILSSSLSGDGTHAGFVANNTSGTLTITGCVFDGQMLGSKTNNCAGFVGWNETKDNANGKVSITNSLFAPTSTEMIIQYTFARSRSFDDGVITLNRCYSTAYYDNSQQVRIYSIQAGNNITISYNGAEPQEYTVGGTVFYDTGLKLDGVLYAQYNEQLPLGLTHVDVEGHVFQKYDTTAGTLSGNDTDGYTLTVGKANATIYAVCEDTPIAWPTDKGSGTSDDPYIIASADQWDAFAHNVNMGLEDYAKAYYRLDADIAVSTMVGTDVYKFQGHFDGNSHKLTVNYGSESSYNEQVYCAPFLTIDGAYIHDLHVEGTIYTHKQFAAGIAGYAVGTNTITNCRSSVTIVSSVYGDGTHGGFVANIQGGTTTITGCAFDGSFQGSSTHSWGGFVGWTEANNSAAVAFSNCLFAPTSLTINDGGCATFSRGRSVGASSISITDCYYISTLGTVQGTQAYASAANDRPYAQLTIAGVKFYLPVETLVSDVKATYIADNAATLSWTGNEEVTSYQVRYRKTEVSYFTDFEEGLPEGWTTIDADGDGYDWYVYDDEDEPLYHSAKTCLASASYNDKALTPDNWLVTKQLDLGGTLRVWIGASDNYDCQEHFAIYLSTTGKFVDDSGNPVEGLITLMPETETTYGYKEYTADLSNYSGQQGYIAIRHFNCTDQYDLIIDDFGIYGVNEWTTIDAGTAAQTITISDLEPNTPYECQVVYTYNGTEYYSPSILVTTLDDEVAPANISVSSITSNTATISWTASSKAKSFNVKFREKGSSFFEDFEDLEGDNLPEDWTTIDADGDGHNWFSHTNNGGWDYISHSGSGIVASESYDGGNSSALEPDNWLITPQLTLGGTLKVWLCGQDEECCAEHFAFYISTTGTDVENFTQMSDEYIATSEFKEYTADLSTYAGQRGYIAIRHFNTTDEFVLVLDDFGIYAGETVTATASPFTITGLNPDTEYEVEVQAVYEDKTSDWSTIAEFTTTEATSIGLADNADNTEVITENASQTRNVTLVGRTLYKDGNWNTLCLPFSLTAEQIAANEAFAGAELMTLSTSSFNAGELTLTFEEATSIEAGVPYIVRWTTEGDNIVNPVFNGVTISNTAAATETASSSYADFVGTYSPVDIYTAEKTNLYLGAQNTLYYPLNEGFNVNAFRAYVRLKNGLTAGEPTEGQSGVRAFALNFGHGDTQGIVEVEANASPSAPRSPRYRWHTLDGKLLDKQPTTKGIYIMNGRKVVVK